MLDIIFGSPIRLKLLKVFIFNPVTVYDFKGLAKKLQTRAPGVRKELSLLAKSKLIKPRQFRDEKGKKRKGFALNQSFPHINALKEFLLRVSPLSNEIITEKIGRTGKLKFATVSGVFINSPESRLDLMVVGDKFNRNALSRVISNFETELGSEIRYAYFETTDFEYRKSMGDKLVRDVLEYPHTVIVDQLGITS